MTLIVFILNYMILIMTAVSALAQPAHFNRLPSYDQMPLNNKTWQEVDMFYQIKINGKWYQNTIQLLRPQKYLVWHHINQIGQQIILTLPEIGLYHKLVTIAAVKSFFTFKACNKNCSQVIGLFKHYVTNVKTYCFKNLNTRKISIIHATPNHPFYVKNKHQFLPISEVTDNDQLIGEHNQVIQLLCRRDKLNHCGLSYHKNFNTPVVVYNLEVYQKHNYRVGYNHLLVHNCSQSEPKQRWIKVITNNAHHDYGSTTMTWAELSAENHPLSYFENNYSREKWVFRYNKIINSKADYTISDIILAQLETRFGRDIKKPDYLVYEDALNNESLKKGIASLSTLKLDSAIILDELTINKLMKSDLGRNIQTLLNEFGWQINIKASRAFNVLGSVHIHLALL